MTEGIHGMYKGRSHTKTRIDAKVIDRRMMPHSVISAKTGVTEGIHENDRRRSRIKTQIDVEVIDGRMKIKELTT